MPIGENTIIPLVKESIDVNLVIAPVANAISSDAVYLLNLKQKNSLVGKEYTDGCYFNPVEDAQGNWIISQEEVRNCTNQEFEWVKTLTWIIFQPKTTDL